MTMLKTLLLAAGLASATTALTAATISFEAGTSTTPSGAGYSFSSTGSAPGSVVTATKNGVTFVGITNGWAGPEVDHNQELLLSFDQDMKVHSLSLGLLFNGPEYLDRMETAIAMTSAGTYRLRVVGEDHAQWSVWNDSSWNVVQDLWTPAGNTVMGGPGLFTVNDPFQGAWVDSIKLTSQQSNSDFGVVRFHGSNVPDHASTVLLLGLALVGASAASRRLKTA